MKLKSFTSYDEYKQIQTEVNKKKLNQVWVTRKELELVAAYVRRHIPQPQLGICHGVRNAFEVATLRELLRFEVIGTEISDTAAMFPNVIQWDFHEVKDEWKGRTDFIYSNSWDHSYNPARMLQAWMSCLSPGGRCFLEWSRSHRPTSVFEADCFGVDFKELLPWLRRTVDVERVLTFNRATLAEGLRRPLNWAKNLILPTRVIVIRPKVGRPNSEGYVPETVQVVGQ